MVLKNEGESWYLQNAIIKVNGLKDIARGLDSLEESRLEDIVQRTITEKRKERIMKQTKLPSNFTKLGDKKISLLLILRALELMSDKDHPLRQIELSKMVNNLGGMLDLNLWCDRKTVGRHIKLLTVAGYKIVHIRNKGYYLEQSSFTQSENELLIQAIDESAMSETDKRTLKAKLQAQSKYLNKKKLGKELS